MKKNAFIMSVFCNSRVKKKQIFAILKRTLFQIFQTLLKLLFKKNPYRHYFVVYTEKRGKYSARCLQTSNV